MEEHQDIDVVEDNERAVGVHVAHDGVVVALREEEVHGVDLVPPVEEHTLAAGTWPTVAAVEQEHDADGADNDVAEQPRTPVWDAQRPTVLLDDYVSVVLRPRQPLPEQGTLLLHLQVPVRQLVAVAPALVLEVAAQIQLEDGPVAAVAPVVVEEVVGVREQQPLEQVALGSDVLAMHRVAAVAGFAAGAFGRNTADATSEHAGAAVPCSSTVLDRDPWVAWELPLEPWPLPLAYLLRHQNSYQRWMHRSSRTLPNPTSEWSWIFPTPWPRTSGSRQCD